MPKFVLAEPYASYSAGTPVEFIEYCDIVHGEANTMLCRIEGVQQTVPLNYIKEKRDA